MTVKIMIFCLGIAVVLGAAFLIDFYLQVLLLSKFIENL